MYWLHKKIYYSEAWAFLSTLGGAYSSLGEEADQFVWQQLIHQFSSKFKTCVMRNLIFVI